MNMFARFNENPAMTLQDIKETKRYGQTDGRTDGRTDNVKTVYPLQTKFAGGIIIMPLSPPKLCVYYYMGKWNRISILLPQPLSNDPWFIQCIYSYGHASKGFVED